MSELRLNPLTREWVIIAGERRRRPHRFARRRRRRPLPDYLPDCPFCPGNEAMTPPSVLEIPGSGPDGWQIRAFPNKYPALSPSTPGEERREGPLFAARGGQGAHEVLVETPRHSRLQPLREPGEMWLLVQAYRERYLALKGQPGMKYVLIFKNHGEEAGTSIEHPHSQIIAAPLLPEAVRRRGRIAREHWQGSGYCLCCQVAQEEMRLGQRMVYQDDGFAVFHPFAATCPGETWIVPLEHCPSFGRASEGTLRRFADVLLRTLRQLSAAFGQPDYNYVIHSAPRGEEDQPHHHWYLQLVPRLGRTAGFELGSGVYINVTSPEETAAAMRRAPA